MPHILVADQIADAGLEQLKATKQVTYDVRHGLSPEDLAAAVGDYDGMLIRSGVQITSDTLARPGRLMAIARAGVGVDNVDLAAATACGVLVMNTPDANTISTAEHTMAVMLAMHRRIPDAHAHVREGQWKRKEYQGHQLCGKTLGIVGLGRIGRAVAERAAAFGMHILAFDPFVTTETALDGVVRMVKGLTELLSQADCVTLHASLTEKTSHLIGRGELAIMKKGAKLCNCARGALVDEAALAEALNEGKISAAAIDVYEKEPPLESPLLTARNVVLTPHLAASTEEAQRQVSVDAVEALLAYLLHGEIRSAVNVTEMPTRLPPRGRAFVDLTSRMGTIMSPWYTDGVERVQVTFFTDSMEDLASTLAWQTVVSVLSHHLTDRVNLVNAREKAADRGITVDHAAHSRQPNQPESIRVVVEATGVSHEIVGTVLGDRQPRIVELDGYRMDLIPAGPMVLIFNDDQPGVIGLVGNMLGEAGVNVADMALSRRGDRALMVLKLDKPISDDIRDTLQASTPPIRSVHRVTLLPVGEGSG